MQEALGRIATHLQKSKSELLVWDYEIAFDYYPVTNPSTETIELEVKPECFLKQLFTERENKICICAIAFKRSLLIENEIRLTEDCLNGEDQEFIYKSIASTNHIDYAPIQWSRYVQRQRSFSHSMNIRKFDVLSAIDRLVIYFQYQNNAVSEWAKYLKYEHKISNFFYNLNSLMCGISLGSWMKDSRELLSQMDRAYPNLNIRVADMFKGYSGTNYVLYVRIYMYRISPILYIGTTLVVGKLKRIISKME